MGLYDGYPIIFLKRWDEEDEASPDWHRTWFGVAELKGDKVEINWIDVPETIYHVCFDVKLPHVVLSFLSVYEKEVKMKGRERSSRYVNFRGTH